MVKRMKRKTKWFLGILSMLLSVFLLTGCTGDEKLKEIPISELVDLSPSNILNIKVIPSGTAPIVIDNPEQIKEICAFLSSAFTLENKYKELFPIEGVDGGIGDCFAIFYLDKAITHIGIAREKSSGTISAIDISGWTKEGEIKGKSRRYSLVNFSQQEHLKEIFSMTPAN